MKKRARTMTENILLIFLALLTAGSCYYSGVYIYGNFFAKPEKIQTINEQPIKTVALSTADQKIQEFSEKPSTTTPTTMVSENSNKAIKPVSGEVYNIEIVKSQFQLYLKQGEQIIKQYPVGIGKNPGQKQRSGDWTTPTGNFFVDEVIDSTAWTHDFKDGKGEIAGAYGPWFISLETGWEGIGIHGTHDPKSIGTMVSEGCIRMHNLDVAELKPFAKTNTKVIITE